MSTMPNILIHSKIWAFVLRLKGEISYNEYPENSLHVKS